MKKRKPARRKRDPDELPTHAQLLRWARRLEDKGDEDRADQLRRSCKQRFRAEMCFNGQKRDFVRILIDEEVLALEPPEWARKVLGSATEKPRRKQNSPRSHRL